MDLPTSSVVVFEDNKTRAELYALWLAECDVELCLTKQQTGEALDEQTAVAILDEEFGDGAAETLLEIIRDVAPACRVVATRSRSSAFPSLGVDNQFVKPVFEEELTDTVRTLLLRSNYQLVLQSYYRASTRLAAYETAGGAESESEQEQLQRQTRRLKKLLNTLRTELTSEDVTAVFENITIDDFETTDEATKVDSKYRPENCANCDVEWDASASQDTQFTRLGAYVWRCTSCGYVQMHVDPSHQHVNPSGN